MLPDDAIFTNGAGNYATWVHRFHRFRRFASAGSADLRLDGLRHPRPAVAAKDLFPDRDRDRLRRRRLLP
jgi:acetolactate synthase-1/2/3 large subunit